VQLGAVLRAGSAWAAAGVTLAELALAFALAAAAGLLAGFAISRSGVCRARVRPADARVVCRTDDPALPLYLLFFGIGPPSKIALGTTWRSCPIVLSTIAGFSQVKRFTSRPRNRWAHRAPQLFWQRARPRRPFRSSSQACAWASCSDFWHSRRRNDHVERRPRPIEIVTMAESPNRRKCSHTSSWPSPSLRSSTR